MKKIKVLGLLSVMLIFSFAALGSGSSGNNKENTEPVGTEENVESSDVEDVADLADTPEDQLKDLAIGDSVTIRGVTVTVNSVTDATTSTGSPAYEVSVTYVNNSGSLLTITPYDWTTVLHTGSDKAHVGGDVSFHLDNISDGEEWTGVVTLWHDDNTEKIKFESSDLNLLQDKKLSATWLLPNDSEEEDSLEESSDTDATLDSAETTSTETTLPDEDQISALVAAADIILEQNFGDDYTISYDEEEKMVTINVWKDGVAAGAIGVQAGTVSKGDWTAMVDGLQSMSESVYDNFEPYGVNVNVNVLNDTNKDNTLLSFLNGVKFYDAVDG